MFTQIRPQTAPKGAIPSKVANTHCCVVFETTLYNKRKDHDVT